jgi:transcriptional regulator with XRE-family HTH domain
MSFELDLTPIENEAGDFLSRLRIEMFKAFAREKKDKGITQLQIAKIMGVDKTQVSRLLRGTGNPTARTISDLAFALDCKPTVTFSPLIAGGNREARDPRRKAVFSNVPATDSSGITTPSIAKSAFSGHTTTKKTHVPV